MGDLELKSFEIISNVGSAISYYIEAIAFAKKYDLHIEHNFEFQGTKNDIDKMKEVLKNE